MLAALCSSGLARADLFSPGDLSKPHATLEGLSQCTKCHPAGGQLSQATCLDVPQGTRAAARQGPGSPRARAAGQAQLRRVPPRAPGQERLASSTGGAAGEKGFNHLRTGWGLKGAHADDEVRRAATRSAASCGPPALKLLEKRPNTLAGPGRPAAPTATSTSTAASSRKTASSATPRRRGSPQPGFNHNDTEYPLKRQAREGEVHGLPRQPRKTPRPTASPAPKSRDLHALRAGRAPHLPRLPQGPARGPLRAALPELPHRRRLARAAQRHRRARLPREDEVPPEGRAPRRRLRGLPRPVPRPAGEVQGPGASTPAPAATPTRT